MQKHGHRAEEADALPDQLLVSVLELLPRHSVLASAALVNKRWLRVSTSKEMWSSKMCAALSESCGRAAAAQSALSWGRLFFAVYQANLLANPGFQQPLQLAAPGVPPGCWVVTAQGGSGWAFEAEPDMGDCHTAGQLAGPSPSSGPPPSPAQQQQLGRQRQPPLVGQQQQQQFVAGLAQAALSPAASPPFQSSGQAAGGRCRGPLGAVASSYRWCELVQVVDLQAELVRRGLSADAAAAFLDASPPLSFSVWYAARLDCPSECEARILLTGAASGYTPAVAAAEHAGGVAPAGPAAAAAAAGELPAHVANSAARLWGWTTGEIQPARGSWHRARCVVAGYPPGARRAVVVLRGRDRRYWAGQYGAKFAAPSLHFLAPEDLEAEGMSACEE